MLDVSKIGPNILYFYLSFGWEYSYVLANTEVVERPADRLGWLWKRCFILIECHSFVNIPGRYY